MPTRKKEKKWAKSLNLKIILKPNDSSTNCTENVVKGSLEIESEADLLIHGILVTVHGKVWTEITSSSGNRRGEQKYSSNIFVQSTYVLGNGSGTRTLRSGNHSLAFTFCLPPHLPSSFEGAYGSINYMVTAQIHTDNERNDEANKTSVPLQVKRFLSLSDGFAYGNAISFPSSMERPQKTLRSTLVPTQSLKFVFKVQKTGYSAGEILPFVLDSYNPERKEIKQISVTLVKQTAYGDLKYNIDVFDELAEVTAQPLDSLKSTLTWIGSLHVPQNVIPTHSVIASVPKKKSIFAHRYLLRVKVVPISGTCVMGDMPIIIGTTKFESRSRRLNDHCIRTCSGGNPIIRSDHPERQTSARRQSSVPPSYSSMFSNERRASLETLPPPYEEAIAMASRTFAKETRHLMG